MIAEDIIQWLICENSDSVGFEVVEKLLGTDDHRVTYIFHF
jgi:hypothetical protein